jgi:hypothetical protein
MVLFHHVVEILDLADFDGGSVLFIELSSAIISSSFVTRSLSCAGSLNCVPQGALSESVLATPLPVETIVGEVNPSLEEMREL